MYVIGTAGHVDHGKSTLVQALTGIDPDRLAEEKAREMTIDLGFAWLRYTEAELRAADFPYPGPVPLEIGVVDVPGHRDFIENMLAGVGGIDLALFVVAADEGVMPQTREHLAILDLLAVQRGLIVITKVDLVEDPDWLELVQLDVSEVVAGTVLADAPLMPVSARAGRGLDRLRRAILEQLQQAAARPDLGRPRLPVDRVFSLPGFGTVVTGTLLDGRFQVGDAVELQPGGQKGRIRGLQTHKQQLETALPGHRVAINLTNIAKDDISRGDIIARPNQQQSTLLLDVSYRHLPEAARPLRHNAAVKLFVGAAERMARVRLLGSRQLDPGQEGWLQLVLSEPVAVSQGDRFILRRPSPGATIGGGQIIDARPRRQHRRFRPEVVRRLETLAQGSPADRLYQMVQQHEPVSLVQLQRQSGLETDAWPDLLAELLANQRLVQLEQQLLTYPYWQRLNDRLLALVAGYETAFPLRSGMPREAARSQLKLAAAVFNPLVSSLVTAGKLVEAGTVLHRPEHAIRFTAAQEAAIADLLAQFERAGVNSPSVKEAKAAVGEDVYYALVDLGRLVVVSPDVVYARPGYEQLVAQIRAYLQAHGRISTAQIRDLLQTSRKYAISLLEHLDEQKITRRIGDERELVKSES
jgi:selenocysteine-specific elongation factor